MDYHSSATAQQFIRDEFLSKSVHFVSYAAGGLGLLRMCTHQSGAQVYVWMQQTGKAKNTAANAHVYSHCKLLNLIITWISGWIIVKEGHVTCIGQIDLP